MNNELEFIKRVLTDTVFDDNIKNNFFTNGIIPKNEVIEQILKKPIDEKRIEGLDWPESAHTMIGMKRLNNLHGSLDYVRENNIEGDIIETGVWRGGASIFIAYYCKFYNLNKNIFVADSFEGLPKPNAELYPEDKNDIHFTIDFLKVSLNEVKDNFKKYGVLNDNVIFLKGWFKNTLKTDKIERLALLRFDGDMYESTMDVFNSLYLKLNKNAIVIIDDYCLPNCKKAIHDFRDKNNLNDEIKVIDNCGIFWIKK